MKAVIKSSIYTRTGDNISQISSNKEQKFKQFTSSFPIKNIICSSKTISYQLYILASWHAKSFRLIDSVPSATVHFYCSLQFYDIQFITYIKTLVFALNY